MWVATGGNVLCPVVVGRDAELNALTGWGSTP
jgi:hypothetical protein